MAQETLHDDPPATETMLAGVGDDLKQALDELRELARGLHPAVLTDRGLAPALQSLANRSPFPVEIAGVPAHRLPEPVEAALYYVVAESLTNAAKHSGATEGRVELSTTPETVVVEIRDNGSGGASLTGGSGTPRTRRPRRGPRRRVAGPEPGGRRNGHPGGAAAPLSTDRRRVRSDSRMTGKDLVEAGRSHAERRADEGGDRVPGHRRHVGERDRTDADRRTDQATSKRRQVRRIVGEAHVHALADGQQRPAVTLASEEPVPPVRVLRGLRFRRTESRGRAG